MNHSFDVDIAVEYGVNAAIILQSIAWWCARSRANDIHFHDGYYWTYNSNRAFQELFPYISGKQISNAIEKLVSDGLIIKGNYNKNVYDRTLWYAVTKKGESKLQKSKMDEQDTENGEQKKVEPIPIISTIISNDINTNDDEDARAREEKSAAEIPNAYGDDDCRPDANTIQQYAINNLKYMGARALQEFDTFVDDLPEDVIRHGIDNALDNDKRTWSYVRAILNSYVEADVKTLKEATEVDKRRNKKYVPAEKAQPLKKTAAQESEEFWRNVPRY